MKCCSEMAFMQIQALIYLSNSLILYSNGCLVSHQTTDSLKNPNSKVENEGNKKCKVLKIQVYID